MVIAGFSLGDLVETDLLNKGDKGIIVKVMAPRFVCVLIISGVGMGCYVHIRGFDLDDTRLICRGHQMRDREIEVR